MSKSNIEKRNLIESMPKAYAPKENEEKWQDIWEKNQIFKYDRKDKQRPTYSIDTPPPYPSGEFHMGNALNWCYFDFVARFKRMQNYNVHFPQGWDCHGLPTEVRAETTYKIKKKDLPASDFKEICVKLTKDYINRMKKSMKTLGFSIDWTLEYTTMDPDYSYASQLAFVMLYEKGLIYRGEHPVNWCPRCETAIAEAEVEYIERKSSLIYIRFKSNEKKLLIATTRPELLAACVAVAINPSDKRYANFVGKKAEIPIYGRTVPIISDEDVDPDFGTGVVMICTFGDKTDVKWQNKHKLPVIKILSEDGKMTEEAGKYHNLSAEDCKSSIMKDLESKKLVEKIDKLTQSIGTCWRCHTPVEIISRDQWFMKTREMLSDVLAWSEKINWVPEFAKKRMIDWAKSLDWDWVISRQRIFATPIPIWYCKKCRDLIIAEKDWLPIDPRFEKPKIKECAKCGSGEFAGENSVMDTWMDSSLTCTVHAGWPKDMESFKRLFPADLQPNGYDIIRTWDYYLMVKNLALFGIAPYKTVLVNGMVRGEDGRMMHKSYGNYVEAGEAVEKYGADSLRQWAAGGAVTGYDLPFNWGEVEYGKKFLTKLWNASRFVILNLQDFEKEDVKLELIDRWIMSKLQKLIRKTTDAYDSFQFNVVLDSIRNFTWHIFCDQYIEAIKYRLYSNENNASRIAAQYVLYNTTLNIIKILTPVCPHISENIFEFLNRDSEIQSVHNSGWPSIKEELIDEASEKNGDLIQAIISEVRKIKSERQMSLKVPLHELIVSTKNEFAQIIDTNSEIVKKTCHIENLNIQVDLELDEGRPIQNYTDVKILVKE
ncbi:MAG: valine--tRNA ligase [Candidatus Bathyarchaeota archaeon]|nr:valine--tRNA ligase [Candidatus Bathyarchaeota archaeon]